MHIVKTEYKSKDNVSDKKTGPWKFIPTQYFAEGLPYIIVNNVSVVMFKSLGIPNDLIGYTSFLYLPWSLKLFWAAYVDSTGTKRGWMLYMQLLLGALFLVIAGAVYLPWFFTLTLICFTAIAFISATHDISIDGYYLHALDMKDQAFFSGIRSSFYRISMIFGNGILVILAGAIGESTGNTELGWTIAFILSAAIFLVLFIYHRWVLPYPETDKPALETSKLQSFKTAFSQYFSQRKIALILLFILLYRFGEGILVKMSQPFLLDDLSAGGMALKVSQVGLYYGTIGVTALLIGGILGGILIKRFSLKKLIFPMALAMNLPNVVYVYLAYFRPDMVWTLDFTWLAAGWTFTFHPLVQLGIILEQFGYGLGFTAFMVYLLYISKGKFKTTHYAISTGIMALGMMLPGFLSGWLQMNVGYLWLFILSVIFTLPGMIIIFFLPYEREEE